MRYNKIIYLAQTEIVEDQYKNEKEVITGWRKVFANEFSVSSNEFYNAVGSGLRPEKRFEIRSFEYENEEKLRYESEIFKIIRTEKKGQKIRITCEKVKGNG